MLIHEKRYKHNELIALYMILNIEKKNSKLAKSFSFHWITTYFSFLDRK